MSKWTGRVVSGDLGRGAVVLILVLAAAPAFAAEGSRQSQEKAARKACLTGDYTTGVSILADLFVDHKNPVYVFNQGRCLEQNSRYKDAILRFEEYLRLGETLRVDSADREAAEKHIADCKAKLAEEEKLQPAPPPPLAQPSPQPVQPPAETAQVMSRPTPEAGTAEGGRGFLIGGIVTGGVGVAAVVAGVILNVKSNNMVDEMQTVADAYTSSKSSSQQTYKALAWVGYGVGAACIATGAVLIGIGVTHHGSSASSVALAPAVGPGQAGVLLRGGF